MVNRAAVIVIGGVVFVGVAVIGGGAWLVFASGGDGEDASGATVVDETPLPMTESPTPTATDAPAAATETNTQTAKATATATATTAEPEQTRTTILPRRFDERRIETLIGQLINDEREAAGYDRLTINGSLAVTVETMARDHSVSMADHGTVSHEINGNHSTNRYKEYDLYHTCKWESGLRNSIVRSDNNGPEASPNSLEAVGKTVAGQEYEAGGETRFNADERAVARSIVESWFANDIFERRLTLPNAGSVGVGIEITQSGEVYATANMCS